MRRFAVILSCCAAIMAVGCSLDEVVEHGETCKDNDGNVMLLEYIMDGSNTYYRKDLTNYLDAFKNNTCPDKSQGCYIDFDENYYCMMQCPSGAIACNGTCVDPNTSVDFCGARGNCFSEDANNSRGAKCENGGSCVRGKCEEKEVLVCGTNQKKCAIDDNLKQMECVNIKTDTENCGDCGVVCNDGEVCSDGVCRKYLCDNACYLGNVCINRDELCGNECVDCTKLENITTASCDTEHGKCKVDSCLKGYHIGENESGDFCEANTDEKCGTSGSHETEDCTLRDLENAEPSYCENSACTEQKCKKNYSMMNGECLLDSLESCAGVNCKELPGVGSVACVSGKCVASSCIADFHLSDGVCVSDEAESCGEPPVNCMAEGVKNATCDSGKCHVFECKDGYHLYENSCEVDDNANCGKHDSSCGKNSKCADKTCVCDKGFHIKNNICEKDYEKACGSIDNNCTNTNKYPELKNASNIICENGECIATTCNYLSKLCNGECFLLGGGYNTERNCGGCGAEFMCDKTQMCENTRVGITQKNSCVCRNEYHALADGTCELNDENNCGEHGIACSEHMICKSVHTTSSKWSCVCDEGYHDYNGVCEADDLNNCGKHDVTCTTNKVSHSTEVACPKGSCEAVSCSSGYEKCGSVCVDLDTDDNYCGSCSNSCGSLYSCNSGECVCNATMCDSKCVDIKTDPNYCGGCTNRCAVPENANATCSAGKCGYTCKTGYTKCGSSCVSTKTDVNNCGSCGVKCSSISHGQAVCSSGSCGFTCDSGYTLVDGICQ